MINPNGIFSEDFNIREFECDQKCLLKSSYILRYMQQVCSDHLDHRGYGYKKLLDEDMVFLLSAVNLNIIKRPISGQNITVSTCPLESKGARFFRETSIKDENGELMVNCITSWLLASPTTRKVYRPTAFPYKLIMGTLDDDSFTKLKMPDLIPAGTRKVVQSDIDVNGHMNNARYADIALDFIPYNVIKENEVESMIIHYKHEALCEEILEIGLDNSTEKVYYIGGSSEGIEKFCIQIVFKR